MFLSLRSLQSAHEHVEQRYDPSAFPPEGEGFRVVSPVTLVFDIDKQEIGRYRLVGHVGGTLELTCGRCLEPFTLPVDEVFDLRYVPRTENTGEGEREMEEDDLTTAFYTDEHIDLGHLMAEQFHLTLPMKPLCSENCLGLCPHCGTNLNTATCNCRQTWEDPRLAALKELRAKRLG
jgi:uncharacterized protein